MDEAQKAAEAINKELSVLKEQVAKAATPESVEEANKALEAFKTENAEALKGFISKGEFDSLKEMVEKQKEELDEANKELVAIQNKGIDGTEDPILSAIKENTDNVKKSIENKGHQAEFVVKANTTRASVANSTDALRLNDVGQLAYRSFILRSLFPVIPVGAGSNGVVRYTDWDDATKVRAAAMVAEGAVFPESTAAWAEYTLDLKKIGDSIPVTEEMLQDQPRFARELEEFLNINVSIVEDDQLYDGDGTGNNLNGIFTSSPAFAAAASGIDDANFYDLIVKVSESITKGKRSKYQPNFALMSITDINRMRLKKDANNNYIIPPFTSKDGSQVASIQVIECAAVTDNSMVLGDRRFAKIYEVEGYNITTGVVNDQFTKDLMTMKAKKRLNLLIREADKGGFAKVTDIDAALVTLAT